MAVVMTAKWHRPIPAPFLPPELSASSCLLDSQTVDEKGLGERLPCLPSSSPRHYHHHHLVCTLGCSRAQTADCCCWHSAKNPHSRGCCCHYCGFGHGSAVLHCLSSQRCQSQIPIRIQKGKTLVHHPRSPCWHHHHHPPQAEFLPRCPGQTNVGHYHLPHGQRVLGGLPWIGGQGVLLHHWPFHSHTHHLPLRRTNQQRQKTPSRLLTPALLPPWPWLANVSAIVAHT